METLSAGSPFQCHLSSLSTRSAPVMPFISSRLSSTPYPELCHRPLLALLVIVRQPANLITTLRHLTICASGPLVSPLGATVKKIYIGKTPHGSSIPYDHCFLAPSSSHLYQNPTSRLCIRHRTTVCSSTLYCRMKVQK